VQGSVSSSWFRCTQRSNENDEIISSIFGSCTPSKHANSSSNTRSGSRSGKRDPDGAWRGPGSSRSAFRMPFHPRCPLAEEIWVGVHAPLEQLLPNLLTACHAMARRVHSRQEQNPPPRRPIFYFRRGWSDPEDGDRNEAASRCPIPVDRAPSENHRRHWGIGPEAAVRNRAHGPWIVRPRGTLRAVRIADRVGAPVALAAPGLQTLYRIGYRLQADTSPLR
jgi:hypothetical protein